MFRYKVRRALRDQQGYECQEADGDFMLAFSSPCDAARFCLEVGCLSPFHAWPNGQTLALRFRHAELMRLQGVAVQRVMLASCRPPASPCCAAWICPLVGQVCLSSLQQWAKACLCRHCKPGCTARDSISPACLQLAVFRVNAVCPTLHKVGCCQLHTFTQTAHWVL